MDFWIKYSPDTSKSDSGNISQDENCEAIDKWHGGFAIIGFMSKDDSGDASLDDKNGFQKDDIKQEYSEFNKFRFWTYTADWFMDELKGFWWSIVHENDGNDNG